MGEVRDPVKVMEYYDTIAPSYNELYGDEQLSKYVGIEDVCGDGSILDVGCGTGLLIRYLHAIGREPVLYVCLDISREMLDRCEECSRNGLVIERIASDMGLVRNLFAVRFDCVALFTVLLARYDVRSLLTDFMNVLSPGGRIVYTVLGERASCPLGREVRRISRMEVLCVVENPAKT